MKQVALLGMPNAGKSTLFNRLTGAHARVGNWPGITVELLTARLLVGGDMVQLVDLPGIYDLHGYSEDEKVVTTFLQNQSPDLMVVVLNACQLDRQMHLLGQLIALGRPLLNYRCASCNRYSRYPKTQERLGTRLGASRAQI